MGESREGEGAGRSPDADRGQTVFLPPYVMQTTYQVTAQTFALQIQGSDGYTKIFHLDVTPDFVELTDTEWDIPPRSTPSGGSGSVAGE